MATEDIFNPGTLIDSAQKGDAARQAVHALRGYAYQVVAATLAWLNLADDGYLVLEVAEDYAIIANGALQPVQVKDTARSGSVTLVSESVVKAIESFVSFANRYASRQIEFLFVTTSEIGTERAVSERPAGMAGLQYWRRVSGRASSEEIEPLRVILQSDRFSESVRIGFVRSATTMRCTEILFRESSGNVVTGDLTWIREELEARLVLLGRDRFHLPAPEARRLTNHLIYEVLKRSINETPRNRVLSRADLYSAIDAETQLTVPRAAIESVLAGAALSRVGGLSRDLPAVIEAPWLVDGAVLCDPEGMIRRSGVESEVSNALREFGISVLIGASGLGKSIVARAVAGRNPRGFSVADFRNADSDESRHRLDMIFARIGGLRSSVLIFDDMDCIDNQHAALHLSRVIDASRRHNCEVILTCHRSPAWSVLAQAGFDRHCLVNCPYFTEEEVCTLVASNGGDPATWGRLAFLLGSSGHPQLTHAFVIGMMAGGWPAEEIGNIIKTGLRSKDIAAAREAARRYFVSALPEGTRRLLYRLSLTSGAFGRSLALAIGDVPAAVPQTGECLDHLVGPWIETVGEDKFRVSPLASDLGRDMLPTSERQNVHETFAVRMADNRTIDASDANTMMVHAIAGRVPQILVGISQSVLTADAHTLEMLAEHLYLFRFAKVDEPMYPEDPKTSWILKLAQFKLAAAAGDGNRVSEIVTALFRDVASLPSEDRDSLEVLAVLVVLCTVGVANYVDGWLSLLERLEYLVEANSFLQDLTSNFQNNSGLSLFGGLFSIGIVNLDSVRRLERIINALNELDENKRDLWMTPVDESHADYHDIISGPWAQQWTRDRERFDAADAATRYERMAVTTRSWRTRSVSLQCAVAQAVMMDEHLNDKEGGLRVLRETISRVGDDPILGRALANVYFRHGDHRSALNSYRGMTIPPNLVERAFTLRKAAISAAKCGEWSQAQDWFLEAEVAAASIEGHDMAPMATGLRADSALVAFEAGNTGEALTSLANVVQALSNIDPDDTLRAAYCHRVVRHLVLWILSRIGTGVSSADGTAITLEAGACSNPDPSPTIRERPLAHIDIVWYMLAKAEAILGVDVGIRNTLEDRLKQGSIPIMEIGLRTTLMERAIRDLDVGRLTEHFKEYVEAHLNVREMYAQRVEQFNPLDPRRGDIPVVDGGALSQPVGEQAARDALLAFGIVSAIARRAEAVTELAQRFPTGFPGRTVLDQWNGQQTTLSEFDRATVAIIQALLRDDHVVPDLYWTSGVCFLVWMGDSRFKDLLADRLAAWQRREWQRIVAAESFRLARPQQTVPAIEEALTVSTDDRRFVAKLLLVASDAVDTSRVPGYREVLKPMANEE